MRTECRLGFLETTGAITRTGSEQLFADLWRRYFGQAAVEERANPRLQQAKVPGRYRRHLTESSEFVLEKNNMDSAILVKQEE